MANNKTVKTAAGQEIDMQALILKNEKVRAVGNMNVNARGDVIDNANKITSTRSTQVNKNYRKQIGNVAQDVPVATSKKAAASVKDIAQQYVGSANDTITGLDEAPEAKTIAKKAKAVEEATVVLEDDAPTGLAAAIAKAREVKQEAQPTPREDERSGKGVKKI